MHRFRVAGMERPFRVKKSRDGFTIRGMVVDKYTSKIMTLSDSTPLHKAMNHV